MLLYQKKAGARAKNQIP